VNNNIRSQPAAAPPEIRQERPGGVALEARDISKRFGGQAALRNVSLSLETGKTHGIIGENGAGKSTLISILAGITTPDEGALRMDGPRPDRGRKRHTRECPVAVGAL
jgi:ribose transport system ATP-binding protein